MNNITKISKDSVSELVYNQLKENVVNERWVPGDKIPSENQLAELFGVSRVSVRVAIQKMITLGLLEAKVGEGTFVKEFTPSVYLTELAPIMMKPHNQIEILEFRKALETEVIRLAFQRAGEEGIHHLEQIYIKMCQASEKSDLEEYFYLDRQFHEWLFRLSENSLFVSTFHLMGSLLLAHYESTVQKSWEVDGVPKAVEEDEHYNIVIGLKTRNLELALKAYVDMIDAKLEMFRNAEQA
ncbi:FadR/GntR family transcriptional regulator [Desulfosporosinus sp. SYSU MS00001]|uniref:FadR/GntR family transcriptional regulator n=1 Tax=Desulfosporosinus sp. SYSU MS00001 TaxID=3416284 RepID=UPI003CE88D89